jgi:Ca2+-binding RTX toxin-like protein
MYGGAGDDTYIVDSVGDKCFEFMASGTDTVKSHIDFDLGDLSRALGGVENLTLLDSADINGKGNVMDNVITGNAGSNQLSGLGGNDTIYGRAGADRLSGGAGMDTLTGGDGADEFKFDTAPSSSNVDRITDFAHGIDKIVLDHNLFTTMPLGTLAGDALVSGPNVAAGADTGDRIAFNTSTGGLYYDADGSGVAAAVQIATVFSVNDAHPPLTPQDIVIV